MCPAAAREGLLRTHFALLSRATGRVARLDDQRDARLQLPRLHGGCDRRQIGAFRTSEPGNQNCATITIGGNDLGFSSIMVACLHHFWGNCERAKANTRSRLNTIAADLAAVYGQIVDAVSASGGSRQFLLNVVGYIRLFSVETNECDDYNFGFSPDGRLTQALPGEINDLVLQMNQ